MTHVSIQRPTHGTFGPVEDAFRRLSGFLARLSEANARVWQVSQLFELDDEALSRRGLSRTDIVQHVYRDEA